MNCYHSHLKPLEEKIQELLESILLRPVKICVEYTESSLGKRCQYIKYDIYAAIGETIQIGHIYFEENHFYKSVDIRHFRIVSILQRKGLGNAILEFFSEYYASKNISKTVSSVGYDSGRPYESSSVFFLETNCQLESKDEVIETDDIKQFYENHGFACGAKAPPCL